MSSPGVSQSAGAHTSALGHISLPGNLVHKGTIECTQESHRGGRVRNHRHRLLSTFHVNLRDTCHSNGKLHPAGSTLRPSLTAVTSGTQEGRTSPADTARDGMQNSAGKSKFWANLACLAWLAQASCRCAICSFSVACCVRCLLPSFGKAKVPRQLAF